MHPLPPLDVWTYNQQPRLCPKPPPRGGQTRKRTSQTQVTRRGNLATSAPFLLMFVPVRYTPQQQQDRQSLRQGPVPHTHTPIHLTTRGLADSKPPLHHLQPRNNVHTVTPLPVFFETENKNKTIQNETQDARPTAVPPNKKSCDARLFLDRRERDA